MSDWAPFKSARARDAYLARYELRAKLWPVPSEERVVPTSFGQTFVRVSGPRVERSRSGGTPDQPGPQRSEDLGQGEATQRDGMPLLMLPGIGSTGLTLGTLVAGLSGAACTYVIDNIHDVGRSIASKSVTSADEFCAWLDEVRRGLGLDQVNLLGLSYGGWISAQYALRFPEVVRRVVLIAPAGTTSMIPFAFIRRAILCVIPARTFMQQFMGWVAPTLKQQDAAAFEEMVEDGYLATRSLRPKKMVPPMPLTDAEWARYRSRTLFLAGTNEVVFDAKAAVTKLARVAPHVETELFEGVGHDLTVVRSQEVNRRVLSFLTAE